MKRSSIAFLAVICVLALVPRDLGAGVGLKVGYAQAVFTQSPSYPWEYVSNFVGGLSFEGGLGFVSLQPEILYVRVGGKHSLDVNNSLENRLDYIQAPVLLKFNIIPVGPLRVFISGGAYGAYLIKAEEIKVEGGATSTRSRTDELERFDYGALGGAGLAFKLIGISLSVEGRYNYGLMNIVKTSEAVDSIKNRCWMALVGISF